MTLQARTHRLLLVALAFAAGIASASARGGEGGVDFDDASRKLLSDEVFSDTPVTFALPTDIAEIVNMPRSERARRTYALGVLGGLVMANDENGSAKEYAGTGFGQEIELQLRHKSGRQYFVAWSQVDEGLWSAVDNAEVRLSRYLLGARLPLTGGRAFGVSLGGGVAYNQLDIQVEDPNADIKGYGGYVDLALALNMGRHMSLNVTGRYLAWLGEDGVGGEGSEQSTIVVAGVTLAF